MAFKLFTFEPKLSKNFDELVNLYNSKFNGIILTNTGSCHHLNIYMTKISFDNAYKHKILTRSVSKKLYYKAEDNC